METKFTKGNWFVEQTKLENSEIIIQTVLMTDLKYDDTTTPVICDLYKQTTEEGKANAKLLCAAPDMLKILLELKDSTSYWSEYEVPLGIVERINSTINKALGLDSNSYQQTVKSKLDLQLKTIRDFQQKYPKSHVGGSFGLFLLGYDLKRDISNSDLDLICPDFHKEQYLIDKNDNIEEVSNTSDFHFKFIRWFGNQYIKHDICICNNQDFQIIEYQGEKYNVSLFKNIMEFKRKYAKKGVFKHKADIEAIKTGVRPVEEITIESNGDLPF